MRTKTERSRFGTGPLLAASVLLAAACFLPFLFLRSFDFELLLYLAAIAFIVLGLGLFVLLRGIFSKSWPRLRTVVAVVTFAGISLTLSHFVYQLRPLTRWLLFSTRYKSQVLKQPASGAEGIRFMNWDGWGWAGADTEVYLVYDPSDTLQRGRAEAPGKTEREILEKAQFIQRLSPGWYSATLYTDQYLSSAP